MLRERVLAGRGRKRQQEEARLKDSDLNPDARFVQAVSTLVRGAENHPVLSKRRAGPGGHCPATPMGQKERLCHGVGLWPSPSNSAGCRRTITPISCAGQALRALQRLEGGRMAWRCGQGDETTQSPAPRPDSPDSAHMDLRLPFCRHRSE